ncbi:probable atp-dependent rna helicase dhx35-like [Plasmopara halstedii]|uniref:RNA helicase n=1 Tax=Plasmopara halstedii TaxID=4781 RepID=A0A0P1AZ29_PLAHL|nr:probable atp-dependent rna helicase dhx35-like [Plasmopara halstedii]CEG46901.1 probable atp-dependent rna helicase dhx35-like [Plasmopara halstedii]|eukprot:XP_024583270.1 probable atp-dependent rna helicase dhx35-like [Plasmopara halstedii]
MSAFWRPGTTLPGADAEAEAARDLPKDAEVLAVQFNPLHGIPLRAQRNQLPVLKHRDEILYAVETHATTIIVGATGSGKTTQVPQYLLEAGWAASRPHRNSTEPRNRVIVCTQPRRVAAVTIAERVAQEVGCNVGEDVGYAVRFEEKWDPVRTKIKFVTDGLLLRETMRDPLLLRYSVVMLDEAHERNLETDLLLGLIKKIQRKRPDLRVIIASATLQVDTFVRYFRSKKDKAREQGQSSLRNTQVTLMDVAAVSVEGRQYPVDIEYLQEPCGDFLQKAIDTVLAIDEHEGEGDVLVFLPGQEEIDFVIRALNDRAPTHILSVPLYGTLPLRMQQNAFLPAPRGVRRKVIVATTIAETSVTIEGVVYVVDGCFTKLAFYNPITGVEALITHPLSKASAKQRAGRAGRSRPGKCFRLCTQDHFRTQLAKETIPQMQRTNLATVALYLLSMGIHDLAHFDFISPPSPEALVRALELLFSLGAIDEECRLLDPLGTQMAEFPVAPTLAKVLLASFRFSCTHEMVSIASVLSVGDLFMNPRGSKERQEQLAQALKHFAHPDGDHMTYISIYNEFVENNKSRAWCDENLLSYRALVRATEIRRHLRQYVTRFKPIDINREDEIMSLNSSCNEDEDKARSAKIRRCLVTGYFANAAKLHADGVYRTLRDERPVQLHPTSIYYHMGSLPDWIIFHQSVLTTEEFVRDVSRIDPRWLVELVPDFYRTKEVSNVISGSSGTVGLPSSSSSEMKIKKPKTDAVDDRRILFRKPKRFGQDSKPKLPVHIGKSKGGLRSQF